MDSPPLASRHFISTPLPRQHVLSFKLRGGGAAQQYICAQPQTRICVLDTAPYADPARDLNTLLWKAEISLFQTVDDGVPVKNTQHSASNLLVQRDFCDIEDRVSSHGCIYVLRWTLSAEWGGYDVWHVHLVAAYCDHCSEYQKHLRQWTLSNITLW